MPYENIQADCEGEHISEESQCGNPEKLRFHLRGADDAGTDEQRHDPEAHDHISDEPAHQMREFLGRVEFHMDSCLSLKIFLQRYFDQGRNVQRAADCLVDAPARLAGLCP